MSIFQKAPGKGATPNIFQQHSGKSIFSHNVGLFQGGNTAMAVENGKAGGKNINPQKNVSGQGIFQQSGKSIFAGKQNNNLPQHTQSLPKSNVVTTGANIFTSGAKALNASLMYIEDNKKMENIGNLNPPVTTTKNIFASASTMGGGLGLNPSTITFKPENIFGAKNELYKQSADRGELYNDTDMMMDGETELNEIKEIKEVSSNNQEFKLNQKITTEVNVPKSTGRDNSFNNKNYSTIEEFENGVREKFGITRIV